ncbi:hypothetical protein M0805_007664 [Coniferiporia weirii]|nr:hypothetical protein M0805_007664 [Coniferiporia weirii]
MVPLERPVLSLAIDAVVKVDGEDALCGLLTLFCKCKGGLQDGDRLENMAWRLWHVERSSSHSYLSATPALSSPVLAASPLTSSSSSSSEGDSDVSSDGETWDHDQTTTLCGGIGAPNGSNPALEASLSPSAAPHGRPPLKGSKKSRRQSSPASTASRTLSSCRRPSLSSRRTHSNTSIGQIMADLLPDKLAVYGARRVPSQGAFSEDSLTLHSSSGEVTPVIVMPSPEATLKQSQPQSSSPPRPQLDRSMRFPTVVIVNPTPHPTPPMTPQVSPPPTSPPRSASAIVGLMPKRDTLAVFTRLPASSPVNLPLTPESIEQKSPIEDRSTQASHRLPEANGALLPPASGPKNEGNGRPAGSGVGKGEGSDSRLGPADPNVSANGVATNKNAGKSENVIGGGSYGTRLGASLNPPERRFFIAQVGSPDGDSPDTSASSQVGSQSVFSVSMTTSSTSDQKAAVAATTAGCEPASVSTARSHSSGGSSSRSGLRMKSRKSAAPVAKGKGKDAKHGHGHGPGAGPMRRSHSGGRVHMSGMGLSGGTIQRSKVGGRTAASLVGASLFGQVPGAHSHHAAPVGVVARHNPPPSPLRPTVEVEKEKAPRSSSKVGRTKSKSPARSSSVARQHRAPATQMNGKGVNGGASAKAGSASGSKAKGQELPASSSKQRRLELADDSDLSTEDEEWDTEECSEEAERTSEEHEYEHAATTEADRRIAEAVAEAQRQRELFAKVDRRSYTNLNRAQSGLLSSMFHPDPAMFPPDHPYRQTRSTQDILAPTTRPLYPTIPLQPTRSAAAVPVAATVTAHGVGSPDAGRRRSPLRLKGRPEDVEESDSGEEDEENKVQISASVAEQRLAALHKGKRPAQPSQLSQQQQQQQLPQRPPPPQRQNTLPAAPPTQGALYGALADAQSSQLGRVATAPIPLGLGYPYNLPPPMPPSTPRTTRRNMLTHELSESLRRNLLWERQVSKQRPIGLGRRAVTSTIPPRAPNGGGPSAANGNGASGQNGDPSVNADELRKQKALARNRSWADNYHAAGW